MKMAGPLHPPFSLFLPEEKEKTGRARSKREKEVRGNDAGARLNDWPKPGMTSPRRSQTGAGGPRLGVFLFPLSLAGSRIGLADVAGPIRLLVSASENSSWSVRLRTKPPLNPIACGEVIPGFSQSFRRAPASFPRTSFSLLDRARPVFSFSSGKKKRKWGVQSTSHLHG